MSPPSRLLDVLAAARHDGQTFSRAWPLAVEAALADVAGAPKPERQAWRTALEETRPAWLAGWRRQEFDSRPERALSLVADSTDREPIVEGDGRSCDFCGKPIAPDHGRRAPAKYCARSCRNRAWYQRSRAA